MFKYKLYINNNFERMIYLRIFAAKNFPMRINIIRNSQIKMQERRHKNVIKYNRGQSKEAKNIRNILKKLNRGTLRDKNIFKRDCSANANPKRRLKFRNYYKIKLTYSSIY
jgi:hypothetical protein